MVTTGTKSLKRQLSIKRLSDSKLENNYCKLNGGS